ncbi:hypothetical protein FNF29_04899 [Cafeteria roenbergensis]|uniref:Uncharacterized protein n=1 Tax=Cafeteria roenbergensis TaxID=33653 RepID=A0A5A8CE89_CAFRO|nr:hypothetical protein FNF29_04899 [Cafeteria roenbergensis]|eukprot:KAA0151009.1 hypothetical protein FNF29_04899 [Cafeteria roenbergensis]
MMSTLGRAVRAWQRLQRDDFLRRPRNVYQYTWDAARVSALVFGGYCCVKLAWELAYETMPDAFRSAELAKASAVEMDRERANAWNDKEERPMSEREFLASVGR